MTSYKVVAFLLVGVVALGCSNSGLQDLMCPEGLVGSATILQPGLSPENNHYLWGLWGVRIDVGQQSADIIPLRIADIHLNVVGKLEVDPCTHCLIIDNIVGFPPDEVEADVRLEHPYPGNLTLTGFDVRGIFISGADYTFPGSGRSIAWGNNLPRVLNPDGYTTLFNPTEFPETLPSPPILKYFPGKNAPGGDLSATLNPYIAYAKDAPRRMFDSSAIETRTVRLRVPAGSGGVIEFGYAVDASWKYVDVVNDPVQDFPPNANSIEAYRIDVIIKNELAAETWSHMPLRVEVFDHQGQDTISTVSIEAPDLFPDSMALDFVGETAEGGFAYEGIMGNESGVPPGSYPLLVRVEDVKSDPNLGVINAWDVASIHIMNGWAQIWDGGGDKGVFLAFDTDGNLYISGMFGSIADLDPGQGVANYTSNGGSDVYLSKLDTSGKFLWAVTWGGSWNDYPGDTAVDGAGNVYVTGSFAETADFDPGPGIDEHTAVGATDGFLVKFAETGDFQWVMTWGGYGFDHGRGIAISNPDSVYVTGSEGDSYNAFLRKFDASGSVSWVRTWGKEGGVYNTGHSVAVVGDKILVVGCFANSIDFNPGPGVFQKASSGYTDAFITQLDNNGDFQGACCWGGSGWDYAKDINIDPLGNGIVVGQFQDTVDFDPGPGLDQRTALQSDCFFVGKYNPSGEYQWVRTWQGPSWVQAVDSDSAGNIFIVGAFRDLVDFDPGSGVDEHSSYSAHLDVYLTTLSQEGDYRWAQTWGGTYGDIGKSVALYNNQRIYVAGSCNSQVVDFDPGPGIDEYRYNQLWGGDFLSMFPANGLW